MAQFVVDLLEMIDVYDDERERRIGPIGLMDRLCQGVLKQHSVVQTGELVCNRLMGQFAVLPANDMQKMAE